MNSVVSVIVCSPSLDIGTCIWRHTVKLAIVQTLLHTLHTKFEVQRIHVNEPKPGILGGGEGDDRK